MRRLGSGGAQFTASRLRQRYIGEPPEMVEPSRHKAATEAVGLGDSYVIDYGDRLRLNTPEGLLLAKDLGIRPGEPESQQCVSDSHQL